MHLNAQENPANTPKAELNLQKFQSVTKHPQKAGEKTKKKNIYITATLWSSPLRANSSSLSKNIQESKVFSICIVVLLLLLVLIQSGDSSTYS